MLNNSQWTKYIRQQALFPDIVLTELEMTCSSCPSQWDARDAEGNYIYVNYEEGRLLIDLNNKELFRGHFRDDLSWTTEEMLFYVGFQFTGGTVPGDFNFGVTRNRW